MRRLSSFEEAASTTDRFAPFNVVIALCLENGPRPEVVRQAMARLAERHPLLRVRLTGKPGRQSFEPLLDQPVPIRELGPSATETWPEIVEQELNQGFDTVQGPLTRFVLTVREAAVRELIFTFHHSVGDGISAVNLLAELLTLCRIEVEGGSLDWCRPLALPPRLDDLFPPGYRGLGLWFRMGSFMVRQVADEIRYRVLTRSAGQPPLHESGRGRILPLSLDQDRTRRLTRRTREKRVSINAFLSAAMLLAVHRRLYDRTRTGLRNFIFQDLRPYLDPAVGPVHFGCYITMGRYTHPVAPETDIWSLATEIMEAHHRWLKKGDGLLNVLAADTLLRAVTGLKKFRMGTTALSYNGLPRMTAEYGPIRIRDLHGFTSNHVLGPEFSGQSFIWDGRLNLDLLYMDSDLDQDQAEALGREMIRLLEA